MHVRTPTLDQSDFRSMPLNILKEEAREQHMRLEHELDISSRLVDRDSYRRLLTAFYGYWKPWESRVAASKNAEIVAFFAPRWKRGLLEGDLEFLGMNQREIDELPLANVPEFSDDYELLGSMYVTEGSTLGGQFISRMIEQQLNLRDGRGYAFYRSYGQQVGTMWREFGRFFNERISPENLAGAIDGAQQTFEGIRRWLGAKR
jgi:heme oxygenase (biliverdin-IX-beta and delta-forming)